MSPVLRHGAIPAFPPDLWADPSATVRSSAPAPAPSTYVVTRALIETWSANGRFSPGSSPQSKKSLA